MHSLLSLLLPLLLILFHGAFVSMSKGRSFTIDYDANTFLKDGKPFRYIAGSFHYFRAHPESWQRKLHVLRASGLNAVTTYVEWSLHNPKDGVYKWDGFADLERFIRLAAEEDLYVILRPGPYICAERDMGGFPYWLLRKYPEIKMRTYDPNYLHEVQLWYSQLMPKIEPLLYGKGGPIIMVQVENEYGSFAHCDRSYTKWLRDLTLQYVHKHAILFTNDGPGLLKCGHIKGVLPTLDFGPGQNVSEAWRHLRKFQKNGPLVNSEFYPGWLTHWQETMSRTSTKYIIRTLIEMLDDGANVNFYMFHGGTNFGFTAGANTDGPGKYVADVTSYDYDAPMDESGDPTSKYLALRDIIGRYLPLSNDTVPSPEQKQSYGVVKLKPSGCLLSDEGRKYLSDGFVNSKMPLSFEALDQFSGLVLYETNLPTLKKDPSVLKLSVINDRGYVYVDREFIGVLSRENIVHTLPINAPGGSKLQILVESQGRINFNVMNDFKGILENVTFDRSTHSSPLSLQNWTMTKYSFDDTGKLDKFIDRTKTDVEPSDQQNKELLRTGPIVFYGEFEISKNTLYDTYFDPSSWGKGVVFINGFNLGRYWPVVGPQITLYVPKEILKVGSNRVVLVEYQRAPETNEIRFTDKANLDG